MSKKPRFGYEVIGTFSEIPNFIERPLCSVCVVAPVTQAKLSATVAEYLLPPVIQSAIVLGKRVSGYLRLLSSAEEKAIERAQLQHGELLTALTDFRALYSASPRRSYRSFRPTPMTAKSFRSFGLAQATRPDSAEPARTCSNKRTGCTGPSAV